MYKIMAVLVATSIVAGCGTSCEQDGTPLSIIQTSENPYQLFQRTTDLEIESARWNNRTTGFEGGASVSQEYGCLNFLGCGTLTVMRATIPLAPGLNQVTFYEDDGECEWKEDLEITLD